MDYIALDILKGKKILVIEEAISSTYPIEGEEGSESAIEIALQIVVPDYTLLIYNIWSLKAPASHSISELKGQSITEIVFRDPFLELVFDSRNVLAIDLSDEGFIGPELLVLYGPDNLIIVWH